MSIPLIARHCAMFHEPQCACCVEVRSLTAEPSMSDLIVEMGDDWAGDLVIKATGYSAAHYDANYRYQEFFGPTPDAAVRAAHAAWKAAQS